MWRAREQSRREWSVREVATAFEDTGRVILIDLFRACPSPPVCRGRFCTAPFLHSAASESFLLRLVGWLPKNSAPFSVAKESNKRIDLASVQRVDCIMQPSFRI